MANLKIQVKYLNETVNRIGFDAEGKGDWIDLYAAETVELKAGEHKLVHLGVAMKLPDDYEAILAERSSTFKNYGVLQTNAIGVIDNSYSGPEDWWKLSVYATRDATIPAGAKIAQFRIQKRQGRDIEIAEVADLEGKNRGGFGSTGK
jgi:dUTP pyrophosphatase